MEIRVRKLDYEVELLFLSVPQWKEGPLEQFKRRYRHFPPAAVD